MAAEAEPIQVKPQPAVSKTATEEKKIEEMSWEDYAASLS
jgi:hypothetical protein